MRGDKHKVAFGSVVIHLTRWTNQGTGREFWRFRYHDPSTGRRRDVARTDLKDAKAEALSVAKRLHRGRLDLGELPEPTIRNLRRLLEADPGLSLADDYLAWKERTKPTVTLSQAIKEFLAAKEANRAGSKENVRSLRLDLGSLESHFPDDTKIGALTVRDMDGWMATHAAKSPKRRLNLRASAVTLFRWAKRRNYLPPGEDTAAEAVERPKVVRKVPPTFTPDEAKLMLPHVPERYLPWFLLCGFQGLRAAELAPRAGDEKRPLQWEDIDTARGLIIVPAETSKVGDRRVIPLLPSVAARLPQDRKGRIAPLNQPSKGMPGGRSLTGDLGALIGGWRPNALRNSFISYRAAMVGLAQTAMEAGNSESEARKSYNDAKSKAEALAWFAVLDG